ncbi:MAG TPA: peptide chain release factor N(5)-glutamine methyltransferase [Bacteroidales bacterium]
MSYTISQIRNQFVAALSPLYGETEAGQMVRMLFEHFCGISGASLALQKNDFLPQQQYDKLLEGLKQLMDHNPIQYLLGSTWFFNLNFEVNPSVLIPRPETEELVDLIVTGSTQETESDDRKVLDIGTGSGCIAVALKKSLPGWQVSACDISEDALQVARRNAERAGTIINFFKADILRWKEWPDSGSYHIIVSNPPYVCEGEKSQMQLNVVEHEPALALFVPDNDPLVFYRAIAEFAASRLVQHGKLYLEINASYGPELVNLLKSLGYSDIELRKDFGGKDRFVIARKA